MPRYLMLDEATCHELWEALRAEWIPHYYERLHSVVTAAGRLGSEYDSQRRSIHDDTRRDVPFTVSVVCPLVGSGSAIVEVKDAKKATKRRRSPSQEEDNQNPRGGGEESPRHS